MGIAPYLAMTAGEMEKFGGQFLKKALLAGLFSPYGSGLTGIPGTIPKGCPLVLSDQIPLQGHDKALICSQLEALQPPALVLDFQRRNIPEAAQLAEYLHQELPFPVIVSAPYAANLPCPVLIPPAPCHVPLHRHLKSWKGREIWLELSPGKEVLTLTEQGLSACEEDLDFPLPHCDSKLCCHYGIEVLADRAVFRLMRTGEDLTALHEKAASMGITTIGLFQEVGSHWT